MKRWIAAALALASAWPAQGQTLASAFEQAWARHPQALALPSEEDAAAARSARASALWPAPPAISLANRNDRLGQDRGQQEWEAEIAVPLWLPGQQPAQRAEAEQGLLELEARRAVLKWRLAGELRQAWWAVAAARAVRELAQRRFTTAQALEAAVLRRHQAGEAARFEVESLRKRRAALAASLQGTVALTAPVAGEIGAIYVAVGQVVEARETLFEVIDPNRLAVEALAYDAAQATGLGRAFAPLPGGAVELAFVGAGRVLREQSVPLLFLPRRWRSASRSR
jgi:cobalt-zinc-cadmium efflux system outer membrane protein